MGYNLLINGVYGGYNPLTNHLLTSWDIQVVFLGDEILFKLGGDGKTKPMRIAFFKQPVQWKVRGSFSIAHSFLKLCFGHPNHPLTNCPLKWCTWRNSRVLAYHDSSLSHFLGVVPSTFTAV